MTISVNAYERYEIRFNTIFNDENKELYSVIFHLFVPSNCNLIEWLEKLDKIKNAD